MKIGVVTTSYPRSDGDHAGNFVAAHVAALRSAGHQVDVIGAHTIANDLFYRGGAPDALERGGLRTYLAAAWFSVALTREVARRAEHWDLVIAHWLAPSALAALFGTSALGALGTSALGALGTSALGALLGTSVRAPSSSPQQARRTPPILAIAHGGDIHTLRRLGLLAPTLYALRARDVRLAFVSAELREVARSAAPRLASWLDAAIIQPMGIDVARFAALRSTAPAARKTVLVLGRLVPVKAVDVAIAAMKIAATHAPLVIAGDGPERARLEALAAVSHASTRPAVSFLGTVDTTARDWLLAHAACVVIPSRVLPNGRSEGTPTIALEALAAGVPVIASAVGGLRDLPGITHVRADDARALAAAIDRVLSQPAAASTSLDLSTLDWRRVSARLLAHATQVGSALGPVPQANSGTRKPAEGSSCEGGDTSSRSTA